MRIAAAVAASLVVGIAGASMAEAQGTQCANPNALGVARTVEVDTTSGPGFGFEQYKAWHSRNNSQSSSSASSDVQHTTPPTPVTAVQVGE